MAPTFSPALGFCEHEEFQKCPSILAYTGDSGQGYLNPVDDNDWHEIEPEARPRRRSTSAVKAPTRRPSWYTTLSSTVSSAYSALSSRTQSLQSSRVGVSQLRSSMVDRPSFQERSLSRAASMPVHRRCSESSLDLDNDTFDFLCTKVVPEVEVETKSPSYRSRLSNLLPSRSWTQRRSEEP